MCLITKEPVICSTVEIVTERPDLVSHVILCQLSRLVLLSEGAALLSEDEKEIETSDAS